MKHNWALVVAILFMLGAGAGKWAGSSYIQSLKAKDEVLTRRADEMRIRTDGAAAEAKKYQEIEHLAALVENQIRWEPDSTRVIRSLGDAAARLGVRLVETRTVPAAGAADSALVAGGAYQRMRIEARLKGSFWSLLQYVDDIEHSARPMVIESLAMMADRDKVGAGELRVTVSALYPVPNSTGPGATTGGAK
jgi:hypothetical protein